MHRTIGYVSKRLLLIRPGEGRKVFLTFLYFFLAITAYYVIKPVSRALVLDDLGHKMVPYIDLVCAIVMGPIVTLFAKSVDRFSKQRLVAFSFWLVTAVMLVFWKLLEWKQGWTAAAFYVWVSIFSVLVVTLFWLVANDLYRPRDAKRLFGLIGSGGILGGIVGSSIAAFGAKSLGTERLLLLSAFLLVLCWLTVEQLWAVTATDRLDAHGASHEKAKPKEDFMSRSGGFLRMVAQSRYFFLLVALVGLNKLISTLTYYQLNPFIEQHFMDVDAKTAFTGAFFGAINICAFIVQFVCTSWLLRRVGLRTVLMVLPAGLLLGTGALLAFPLFWIAAATELYDHSLNYSLHNTAKELLYLPIDRSIRYKVKPFIDMVVFRFGKGIAAVVGIVLLDKLGMPARFLGFLTVPLVCLWLWIAWRMSREYTLTIRTLLQARAIARREREHQVMGGHFAEDDVLGDVLGVLTAPPPSQRKFSFLRALLPRRAPTHAGHELLDRLMQYEQPGSCASFAFETEEQVVEIKALIQDTSKEMGHRRHAIRSLARRADQITTDYLSGLLVVEEEAMLRYEVTRELVKLRVAHKDLQMPIAQIRRQIDREGDNYKRTQQVLHIYRKHHPNAPENDPVIGLLRVLAEESVQQIFRLLMLVYRPDDIHLVYEQLQATDAHLRADALELLDNLVDPTMRRRLLPILDEDAFLDSLAAQDDSNEPRVPYGVLQEAIWDHNSWLSVTTLCAIGRMRMTGFRHELEKASSHHTVPVVAFAAKTVLDSCESP